MIKPVSAESLRKTGIFADKAGDFRRFPPQVRRTGESGDEIECTKSRDFPGHSRVSWQPELNAGMAGWGGRDRTSEWRNQNPLPYRLATPQLAGFRIGGGSRPRSPFRQRRSIESGAAFQPVKAEFRLNRSRGVVPS